MVGGDVEEFLGGPRLPAADPVDEGGARGAVLECQDDVGVDDVGQLGAALGEAPDVVA